MPGTITPDGQPVEWTLVYFRYGTEHRDPFGSLADALAFAFHGEDEGALSSREVLGQDGMRVIECTGQPFYSLWDAHSAGRLEDALTKHVQATEPRALPEGTS